MKWEVNKLKKKDFKDTILIEGLPGIGNVGKIAADLLVQEFEAEKVAEFFSESLPNAVFVREDNLVELPKIEIHHMVKDGQDFLFVTGDVQPKDTEKSYAFTKAVLDYAESQGCKEIITLGGIGLKQLPEDPDVYCSANDEDFLKEFEKEGANSEIYGKVGPIMGISGLLLGMGEKRGIRAATLLGETLAHPAYIGLKGAKKIIEVLNEKYGFEVSTEDLESEIKDMEKKLKKSLNNLNKLKKAEEHPEMSYIG